MKDKNAITYGVIYALDESSPKALEKFEVGYELMVVPVIFNGQEFNSCTYISSQLTSHKPKRRYVKLMFEGARENSMPAEYIDFLRQVMR